MAGVCFVGVDGASVRYNTFYRPERWVARILQETRGPGFVPSRNGRFEHNLVVFRRRQVREVVNVGPGTAPETFAFAANLWYCEDAPGASRPALPVKEAGGVYGVDPGLKVGPDGVPAGPAAEVARAFGAEALVRK